MEQTWLTVPKSTVFYNLWRIRYFDFGGFSSTHFRSETYSGCGVSWHYILDTKFFMKSKLNSYYVDLSVFIESSNTSRDARVVLDKETSMISGKTKTGSIFGTISIPYDKVCKYYLKVELESLELPLKFLLSEDPLEQDPQFVGNYMSLLTNDELSDVTIQVGPETFYAQKAILSVRSPVFAVMFRSGMQEAKLNYLVVEDIEPDVFKELLRFIYVGKVERLTDMAHELLAAAHKYSLDRLRTLCERHLQDHIEKESVLNTLAFADLYQVEELKKQAILFVCKNIQSMKETDWKSYTRNHPDLVAEILSAMAIK